MLTYESRLLSGTGQAQCQLELMENTYMHAHTHTRAAHATRNFVKFPQHQDQQVAQVTVLYPGIWMQPWEQAEAQEKSTPS